MIAVVLFWGEINGLLCGGCAALDNRSDLRYWMSCMKSIPASLCSPPSAVPPVPHAGGIVTTATNMAIWRRTIKIPTPGSVPVHSIIARLPNVRGLRVLSNGRTLSIAERQPIRASARSQEQSTFSCRKKTLIIKTRLSFLINRRYIYFRTGTSTVKKDALLPCVPTPMRHPANCFSTENRWV